METEDEVRPPQDESALPSEPQLEIEGEGAEGPGEGPVHAGAHETESDLVGEEHAGPEQPGDSDTAPPAVAEAGGVAAMDGLAPGTSNVDSIMDIEIPITVTFGSTSRPLREILRLAPGSRVELNHKANQPVVLKVNNKPFARGQVVVVDGCYGVKIEEIEPTARRIASLGE